MTSPRPPRTPRRRSLVLLAAVMLAAACQGADGGTGTAGASRSLYVIGDSWAELMHEQVRVELDDRGFDEVALRRFGASGSRMAEWKDVNEGPMRTVAEALAEDPTPDPVVLVILGGNDLLDGRATAQEVSRDLHGVVAVLRDARPDVEVVLGSYDIVNPAVEPDECGEFFDSALGVRHVADITRAFREQWTALESTASQLEAVTAVDAFGTLQGRPGDPDLSAPSPTEFLADCIHLNDLGEDLYLDEVFARAVTSALCRTEDAVACG